MDALQAHNAVDELKRTLYAEMSRARVGRPGGGTLVQLTLFLAALPPRQSTRISIARMIGEFMTPAIRRGGS